MSWCALFDDEEAVHTETADDPAPVPIETRTDPLDELPTGPRAADRRLVSIYGMPGYGKTTLAAQLYQSAIARGVSGTWVDTTGGNLYLARAGRASGFRCAVARSIDTWAAHVRTARHEGRPFNIVLVPEGLDLLPFWSLVHAAGNCLLAIDEFDAYATAHTQLIEGHPLRTLLAYGRHRQNSMIWTTRVPPDLHKLARSFASVTIAFRQADRPYAEQLAREAFKGADRRVAEWLMHLPRFDYLRYDERARLSWGTVPRPQ